MDVASFSTDVLALCGLVVVALWIALCVVVWAVKDDTGERTDKRP